MLVPSFRALLRPAAVLAAVLLGVSGFIALTAPAAFAHNGLVSSNPADGATVPVPPEAVTLVFNDKILNVGTAVQMKGPEGDVQLPAPAVDASKVVQELPQGLPGGDYRLVWRVTSADGHPIDGALSFSASAGGANATPTTPVASTSTATPPPTSASTESGAASSESAAQGAAHAAGGPAWQWIAAVIMVISGAVAAFIAVRRGRERNAA